MLIETILGYKSVWRVLELLAENPTRSHTRQEIKKHTNLGNKPLTDALNRLVFAEITIKEEKKKARTVYWLNQANEFTKVLLDLIKKERLYWRMIPYSTLAVLNEFTRKCIEEINDVIKLILFGSVARGTATKNSDIDIAIIVKSIDTKTKLSLNETTDKLERKLKRKIQLHYFTKDEFKENKGIILEIKKEGLPFFETKM